MCLILEGYDVLTTDGTAPIMIRSLRGMPRLSAYLGRSDNKGNSKHHQIFERYGARRDYRIQWHGSYLHFSSLSPSLNSGCQGTTSYRGWSSLLWPLDWDV